MTYEDNPKYMALLKYIADAVCEASVEGDEEDRMVKTMLLADLVTEVVARHPKEYWMPMLDVFFGRLGNNMDRREAAGELKN